LKNYFLECIVVGKGNGSKKTSINSLKKAKIKGRGLGRGRDLKWDVQSSESNIKQYHRVYCDGERWR
jgi:hypothetical protein